MWPIVSVPFAPRRWILASIAIVLGACIRFFNSFAVGLLAFWTTRAGAIVELQMAIGIFLSGQLAPLDLLPHWVQRIAAFTWFPYAIAFPIQLLTGTGSSELHLTASFAGQVFWLLAWWGAYRVLWRRGLLRYGAVGG